MNFSVFLSEEEKGLLVNIPLFSTLKYFTMV